MKEFDSVEDFKIDLDFYLGALDYNYEDGYVPKGFPTDALDFGSRDYWKAINSVKDDIFNRIIARYGLEEVRPNVTTHVG